MSHIIRGGLDIKQELSVGNGAFIVNSSGVITSSGSNNANWMSNISIVRSSSTTIKITSANGTAFSASNIGYIALMNPSSPGQISVFSITADVSILLTGAHWGLDRSPNITTVGSLLRVLAINDNGALKWGVAYVGGRHTLLTTDTSATPGDINLPHEILCNSAIGSATNSCREIGYFRADFTDSSPTFTWAIQTGVNDVVTGLSADGLWQPWVIDYPDSQWGNGAGTGKPTPTTARMIFMQIGEEITMCIEGAAGTASAAGTQFTFTGPTAARYGILVGICAALKNTTISTGTIWANTGSSTFNAYPDMAGTAWTSSVAKNVDFNCLKYIVGPAASFIGI